MAESTLVQPRRVETLSIWRGEALRPSERSIWKWWQQRCNPAAALPDSEKLLQLSRPRPVRSFTSITRCNALNVPGDYSEGRVFNRHGGAPASVPGSSEQGKLAGLKALIRRCCSKASNRSFKWSLKNPAYGSSLNALICTSIIFTVVYFL
jgi:hypothetical protein